MVPFDGRSPIRAERTVAGTPTSESVAIPARYSTDGYLRAIARQSLLAGRRPQKRSGFNLRLSRMQIRALIRLDRIRPDRDDVAIAVVFGAIGERAVDGVLFAGGLQRQSGTAG
jgi:hypothetical protein